MYRYAAAAAAQQQQVEDAGRFVERVLLSMRVKLVPLRRARGRIAELGGTARDGNQLGHLLAGWWTLTSDDAATEAMLDDVTRFTRWIISLTDAEDGLDPATQCWNRLLSADARLWRAGDSLTVGQVIARAREIDNGQSSRNALAAMGLRLLPASPHDRNPSWPEADMGIANNHAGLEEIFRGTEWGGGRWADTFSDLEFRELDGTMTRPTHIGPVRYAGAQSRGVLIPARFLPSIKDEQP